MADPAPRSRPRRSPLSCLGLLVVLLLMAFASAEISFRVSDALAGREASFYLPQVDLSKGLYTPHPYLGLVTREGVGKTDAGKPLHINSLGLRGPETTREKPPGTYRILCVGSSTTFGTSATADDKTYPAQLQALLEKAVEVGRAPAGRRYEVLNGGVSGYNTADALINFELRLIELAPDAVLLYDAANDGRIIQMEGFKPDYSHARRPPPLMELSALERFLLGHVRTYARLVRGTDPEEQVGALANWVFVPGWEDRTISATKWLNEEGLQVYGRNLRSLCAVARSAGIEPVFQTFAVRGAEGDLAKGLVPFIERANQLVHELGAELGVPVVPVAEELTGQSQLFDDWIHFTDAGEYRHAQVIATFAATHGLFGLR